jgi:hypothetical protein
MSFESEIVKYCLTCQNIIAGRDGNRCAVHQNLLIFPDDALKVPPPCGGKSWVIQSALELLWLK